MLVNFEFEPSRVFGLRGSGAVVLGYSEAAMMRRYALRCYSRAVLEVMVGMSRSRTNYWLEFVLDTALGLVFLAAGLRHHSAPPLDSALLILSGLFLFSFIEYCLHRWLLHGSQQLFAQGHARHHHNPLGYDSVPFFLPALGLFALIGAGELLMPAGDALLMAGGIAFGYVTYGLSHFVIHHGRFRHALIRDWAAHHHVHHFHPDRNFGVTSPLWDVLLGTRYVSRLHPRPDIRS